MRWEIGSRLADPYFQLVLESLAEWTQVLESRAGWTQVLESRAGFSSFLESFAGPSLVLALWQPRLTAVTVRRPKPDTDRYKYRYKKRNWKCYASGNLSVSRGDVVQQGVRCLIHTVPVQQNMFSTVQFRLLKLDIKCWRNGNPLTPLCCLCQDCCPPPRNPSRSTWSWRRSPQGWRGSGRFQWRMRSVGQRWQRPWQSWWSPWSPPLPPPSSLVRQEAVLPVTEIALDTSGVKALCVSLIEAIYVMLSHSWSPPNRSFFTCLLDTVSRQSLRITARVSLQLKATQLDSHNWRNLTLGITSLNILFLFYFCLCFTWYPLDWGVEAIVLGLPGLLTSDILAHVWNKNSVTICFTNSIVQSFHPGPCLEKSASVHTRTSSLASVSQIYVTCVWYIAKEKVEWCASQTFWRMSQFFVTSHLSANANKKNSSCYHLLDRKKPNSFIF